jgi:hypothetical protein
MISPRVEFRALHDELAEYLRTGRASPVVARIWSGDMPDEAAVNVKASFSWIAAALLGGGTVFQPGNA